MNKEDRVAHLTAKQRWNIWRIKNRWLRSVAAWAIVLVGVPLFYVFVFVITILMVVVEAWKVIKRNASETFDLPWRQLGRALVGKEVAA